MASILEISEINGILRSNQNLQSPMSSIKDFAGKTVFITGATRGIGLAIAKKLGAHGARIVVTGKTTEPHPKLEGTISSAVESLHALGAEAIGIPMDIRDEDQVKNAVESTASHFGGIDILINNASAIDLSDTLSLSMKRYDLMHHINTRGTFMASKYCLPWLLKSPNPHILTLSPPLNVSERWWGQHLAYTLAKYGMSLITRGLAEEFKESGLGANALWPRTTIATAAIRNLLGGEEIIRMSRKPEIMADAAYYILKKNAREYTGQFLIDDEVLMQEGILDLSEYAVTPGSELMPDIFL
jgi:citronellol/citronellal dehydrogenase